MDPRLLVVAIYAPSDLNAVWYRLQQRYLACTTADYTFKLMLNGIDAAPFAGADAIAASPENRGHAWALETVLEYFRQHLHAAYLILDSDCFPVTEGWRGVLDEQLRRFGKTFAAPVRTENLDLFPHPCAVYLLPDALATGGLNFGRGVDRPNLLGEEVGDVGSAMTGIPSLLPLLRTNARNVHPVAAAIYHHLFYHHGAGSRDFVFRVLKRFAYYEHWYDSWASEGHQADVLDALLDDPERFIGSLMGQDDPLWRGRLRPSARGDCDGR